MTGVMFGRESAAMRERTAEKSGMGGLRHRRAAGERLLNFGKIEHAASARQQDRNSSRIRLRLEPGGWKSRRYC